RCFDSINSDNGKSKEEFLFDLRALSKFGARLFDIATDQVNVADEELQPREWTRALRQTLSEASLIQIARTGRCEYAFPWSLVYDIPMPGPDFKFCEVTDEWDSNGTRMRTTNHASCPYS